MRILGSYLRFVDAVMLLNVLVFIAAGVPGDCGLNWTICELGLIPTEAFSEPWRMITSVFVHEGFSHLLMNMLALYFFGAYIYSIMSERRIMAVYLLGGLAGSLAYLLFAFASFDASINSVVMGASGALFALGGAIAVLRPNLKVMMLPLFIPMDIWKAEVIMLVVISLLPHVAWQGHLGGFVLGALLGYYYKKKTLRVPDVVQFTRIR
jgi:membrane associated rhomboid family serine protease